MSNTNHQDGLSEDKCHRCEGTLGLQKFTYEEYYKLNKLVLCQDCLEYIVTRVWSLFH